MKIGILGGTFDPIHNAHLSIAREALKQFHLDKIYVMPSPFPPHKDKDKITSDFHRTNMVKLALEGEKKIFFSDFELSFGNITYTADTLTRLKAENEKDSFYFILGGDSVISFLSWYKPEIIVKYAKLLVAKRGDESSSYFNEKIEEIEKKFDIEIGVINTGVSNISSSAIREMQTHEIKNFVPQKVYDYIVKNNLYHENNINQAWSVSKITADLKKSLNPHRFAHTLRVADTAKKMAECFGINPNTAYLAGLVHDCAKCYTEEELISICEKKHIEITAAERNAPYLLHAKVGAYFAKKKYKITNKEILGAVAWHTTGRENMTKLEKIIFSADYIEPGRSVQPRLKYLREIAYRDLDMLVYLILEDTLAYLSERNRIIDDNTIRAYAYYKENKENQ